MKKSEREFRERLGSFTDILAQRYKDRGMSPREVQRAVIENPVRREMLNALTRYLAFTTGPTVVTKRS